MRKPTSCWYGYLSRSYWRFVSDAVSAYVCAAFIEHGRGEPTLMHIRQCGAARADYLAYPPAKLDVKHAHFVEASAEILHHQELWSNMQLRHARSGREEIPQEGRVVPMSLPLTRTGAMP